MTNQNNQVATSDPNNAELIKKLVLDNDISKLNDLQKVQYYTEFCKSLGLNPLTQPFAIMKFEGKLMMYARKECTEQLRKIHNVSVTDVKTQEVKGIYIVTVQVKDETGRTDMATGAVALEVDEQKWDPQANNGNGGYTKTGLTTELKGKDLANAIMKAETKAKRRATLSLVGLGLPDESEIESMQGAKTMSFDQFREETETFDEDTLAQWNSLLNDCKTPDDLDNAAIANKEAIEQSQTLRRMFNLKKAELKTGPSAKDKAKSATDTVNDLLNKKK
jgi:hypothetical protein